MRAREDPRTEVTGERCHAWLMQTLGSGGAHRDIQPPVRGVRGHAAEKKSHSESVLTGRRMPGDGVMRAVGRVTEPQARLGRAWATFSEVEVAIVQMAAREKFPDGRPPSSRDAFYRRVATPNAFVRHCARRDSAEKQCRIHQRQVARTDAAQIEILEN